MNIDRELYNRKKILIYYNILGFYTVLFYSIRGDYINI